MSRRAVNLVSKALDSKKTEFLLAVSKHMKSLLPVSSSLGLMQWENLSL